MNSPLIHLQIRVDVHKKGKTFLGILLPLKIKVTRKKKMFLGDKSEWFGEEETDISIAHSTSFPIHQKKLSREIVNMGVFRKLREEGKVEIWAMQPAQGKLSL